MKLTWKWVIKNLEKTIRINKNISFCLSDGTYQVNPINYHPGLYINIWNKTKKPGDMFMIYIDLFGAKDYIEKHTLKSLKKHILEQIKQREVDKKMWKTIKNKV